MMHRLNFKSDSLPKMIEWSNSHSRHIPYSETTTDKRGLWLVKDDGIYLMSPTDEKFPSVVYAKGYKPTKGNCDTLWDKTYAVSPDDFVEFIQLKPDQIDRVKRGGHITIKISATQLQVIA